ncbi:hypothetical protein [Chromobacterium vaccinii]|uniref:hypothetical protein n=1 Tax=Chromobacterium vaccinii TaxID=1108595 RepID=UPI0011C06223|nr:hypothetical protein [Chromobacterium vaccinii]
MGKVILLFDLFVFFKVMQRVVELNDYVIRNSTMPKPVWFLLGGAVHDRVEARSRAIYRSLAWFFGILIVLLAGFGQVDIHDVDRKEAINGSVGLFVFLVWRVMPYVKNVKRILGC